MSNLVVGKLYFSPPYPSRALSTSQTIEMARARQCPTCKVTFPTIDAVNDHYKKTAHIPLPYMCEFCDRVYQQSSPLQKVGFELSVLIDLLTLSYPMKHIRSKHPHAPFLYKCEPCNRVFNFTVSNLLNVRIQFSFFDIQQS